MSVAPHKNSDESGDKSAESGSVIALFKAYRSKLERFLARRAYQPHDAGDLAQEVYMRLLRFPPERVIDQPQAYLYRIASNVVHDFNMRVKEEPVTFDSEVADELSAQAADVWVGDPG